MQRKVLRTIALTSFALVVMLARRGKRKHRTPKHRIRAWPRLTNT